MGDVLTESAEAVATLGEKLSNAGFNTLIGMGTVFIVLILISLIIYCFKFIHAAEEKAAEKQKKKENVTPMEAEPVTEEEKADDRELVSVIAAAIAAYEGTGTDSFIVRSIRKRGR